MMAEYLVANSGYCLEVTTEPKWAGTKVGVTVVERVPLMAVSKAD